MMRQQLGIIGIICASASFLLAESKDEELVKQLSNPVASLISVPFQNNFDFGIGPSNDGWRYTLNFQPVIPISLGKNWNLVVRTIIPYLYQEDVYKGALAGFDQVLDGIPINLNQGQINQLRRTFGSLSSRFREQDGLGDTKQSFFLSPKEPLAGWVVGFGPDFLYPTATDDLLGAEKWAAGPTVLVLRQTGGLTYGVLANQLWSFAGNSDRSEVNATFLQPFLSYATKTKTTFGINTESTYDWHANQWTVPINLSVSQLIKIGKLPLQLSIGGRYYAEGPSGSAQWGLRFVATFLFPTGHQESRIPETLNLTK